MGDQLEKFLMENRSEFDGAEPSNDLWDKIDDRMNKKSSNFHVLWKVAAVLFLISTAVLLIDRTGNTPKGPELSQEFVKAEDYYTSLINQRKLLIKESLSPEQELEFLVEINQLDSMYLELKKTYQTNASNERVIDAMISNLQLRLDILNRQLEILETIKTQKNENESIIEI